MKKLVVIVAALALVAGGFARIRFATAQSPAPPSSRPATATASGGAGETVPGENTAASSDDSDRVATATSARPSPEAFIDLNRVFKETHWFNQQMSAVKDRIQKFDQECKEHQTRLNALRDELKAASDAGRRLHLEKELADGQAKLQSQIAEVREQHLKAEAKIYYEAFEQVRAATAEYARQHGIRVVRRSSSSAYAEYKATDDNVDTTDRKAVLDRINRPVIYFNGPSEIPSDITDAIVQRLNGTRTR